VHEARLPDAGNAFEQHMTTGEKARDRSVHDVLVPDDTPRHFLGDTAETISELIDGLSDSGHSHGLRVK
jgi:hypothetical protein